MWLNLEVADRLAAEIDKGAGDRIGEGVETGGLLLGVRGPDGEVRIEDFEPVPLLDRRDPRFLPAEEDEAELATALERWKLAGTVPGAVRPVGFYRAHRVGPFGPRAEDWRLIGRWLQGDDPVLLVARPRPGLAPEAAFFLAGEPREAPPLEGRMFVLDSRQLAATNSTAMPATVSRSSVLPQEVWGTGGRVPERGSELDQPVSEPVGQGNSPAVATPEPGTWPEERPASRKRWGLRTGWVWIPLSFVFLLLGTVLGFHVALSLRSALPSEPTEDPYRLYLSASRSAQAVHLRWNRYAPAIRQAEQGRLIIDDGSYQQVVQLDAGHLRNGSVIYRPVDGRLRFRLEVEPTPQTIVSEVLEMDLSGKPAR